MTTTQFHIRMFIIRALIYAVLAWLIYAEAGPFTAVGFILITVKMESTSTAVNRITRVIKPIIQPRSLSNEAMDNDTPHPFATTHSYGPNDYGEDLYP